VLECLQCNRCLSVGEVWRLMLRVLVCVCVEIQRICCLSSWVFGFCNVDSQYCHSADCDVIGRVRKQRLLILDPLLLDLCSLLVIKTTRSVDKRAKDNNLFCFIAVVTKVQEKHASFYSFLQIKVKI